MGFREFLKAILVRTSISEEICIERAASHPNQESLIIVVLSWDTLRIRCDFNCMFAVTQVENISVDMEKATPERANTDVIVIVRFRTMVSHEFACSS